MSDPFDQLPEEDPFDALPEGGAEGGTPDTAPSKAVGLTVPHAEKPAADAPEDPARAKQTARDAMVSLTHGQGVPLDEQEDRGTRHVAGALGEGIATARGVPLVGSHIDELSALLQAHAATGPEYEKKRDEARKAVDEAVSANPKAPLMGSLAFAPLAPETGWGRLGLATAEGASEGAGSAKNMSDVPRATLAGGGAGLATGLTGEALVQGGDWLGSKKAGVLEKNQAAIDKTIDKGSKSVIGAVGNKEAEAAQALRTLEERANSTTGDPVLRERAKQLLASDYANELRDQIATGYMRRWENLGPAISKSRQEMTDYLTTTATPEGRAAAAQARVDDPSALIRRARELGPKVLLPALGAAVAGPAGAAAGAGTSAVLGRSATTVRNLMTDPYVATRVLGAGNALAGGAGRAAQSMTPAASKSTLEAWEPFLHKDDEAQK